MSKLSKERKQEADEQTSLDSNISQDAAMTTSTEAAVAQPFFAFKNEKLNAYSAEIAAIRDEMGGVNFKLAKVLGKVKSEKCYEDDGFKSVAEYAESTFSIKRSMAYQLAAVGERFYNAESETAAKVAGMLTPSNLSEIVKLTDEQIQEQIELGAISNDSTQASLREVANHVKQATSPSKPKVLPQYVVDVTIIRANAIARNHFDRITMEELSVELCAGMSIKQEYISKTFVSASADANGVDIWLLPDGGIVKLEYAKYVTEVEAKRKSHKNGPVKVYTREELEAMLAALNAGEDKGE